MGDGTLKQLTRRSRSLALLVATTLLVSLAVAAGPASPAGAATVTTQAALNLTCTANAPIVGAQTVNQALTIDIEHPDAIPRNTTETITISQPPLPVPAALESGGSSYPIINLNSLNVAFKVTPQFRIEAVRTVGGTTAANVTYTPAGDLTFAVPGPLLGGQTYTLPTVEIDVKAVGTVGTSGSVFFQSFNLIARASLPIVGDQNIPTSCPTPTPNPALFSVAVAPGAFSTDPDPVSTTGTIDQLTKAKYGSTAVPSNNDLTSNPFSVTTTGYADIAPGASTTLSLSVGARDWVAPYAASPHDSEGVVGLGSQRRITGIQNWAMTLNGPDPTRFQVVSVTSASPGTMTAAYDAGTNVITLARPTGAGGALGEGVTFTPPTVSLVVKAIGSGPYPQLGTVTFRNLSWALTWQQRSCIIICGSFSNQTNLGPTTTAVAAQGGNPVGTQPNGTMFFRPVSPSPTVGSLSIVVPPGSAGDSATVANNDVDGVDIDVLANDTAGTVPLDPGSVFIVDEPSFGTVTVDPVTGVVTYVPEYGTLEPEDGFTYAVQDVQGRYANLSSVVIDIVGLYCEGPCSLTQTIVVDVVPDTLSMDQAAGSIELDTVILDGQPAIATAALQEVAVVNERGGTAPWDVTGQLTSDFKTDPATPDCPADTPGTWSWRCVPGDNLGWEPLATVAHDQVPGDVAVAEAGTTTTGGLRSSAQQLCGAPATQSGGSFDCGALVSLGVPASAGTGRYAATLTLTLA